MAEYQSRVGQSSGGIEAPPQELNIIDAIKKRYDRPGSAVMKILSTLSLPAQAISSMVREGVEREQHPLLPQLSMGQAALRGVANPETSYADVPGVGEKTGVALDVAIDPMWLVPGKVFTSAGSALARNAGRVAGAAVKLNPTVDRVVAQQLPKFIKHYAKTRAGYKGFEGAVEVPARMAQREAAHDLGMFVNRSIDDIHKLVPDVERRKKVLEAAEVLAPQQEITALAGPHFQQFNRSEQKAILIARESGKRIEAERIKWGTLSEDTARSLEERMNNASYFQHSTQPREAILADMDAMEARHSAGWTDESRAYFNNVRQAVAEADPFPAESYIREMMHKGSSGKTSFQRERQIVKSIEELSKSEDVADQVWYAMLEKDVATNLHQATNATGRSVYRKVYLDSFVKYMRKHGLLHSEDEITKLPGSVRGKGDNALVKIEGIKELEGMYGPRVLVQDIKDQILSPLDPDRVRNATSLARRLNYYFRGWALSVPMTTVRNAVDSVIWRNAAGGMGPKDAQYMVRTVDILKKAKAGTLDTAEKAIYRDMIRGGIVRSNPYEETLEMSRNLDPKNWLQRLIDPNPSKNPYTRFFFDKGGNVEDTARGSMFLWRRAKGDTVEQAAKLVNKWHIDYQYGLTNWERGVRDRYIPFLTFTRFNMPLALETLVMKPKLVAAAGHAIKTHEDLAGGPEPDFPLGGWMASGTPMRWHYDAKTKNYFIQMLDNWWSFTDINKFDPGKAIDTAANMISPIYVRPYEIIKNHNLFLSQGRTEKVPVEKPGDKFQLLGAKAEFPFDKRLEYLVRTFRPIDETDKVLQAFSSKYGEGPWQRGINALNRMLFGRQYPVDREGQLRVHAGVISNQLQGVRAAKKKAEAVGDTKTYNQMVEEEEKLKQRKKDLGIK